MEPHSSRPSIELFSSVSSTNDTVHAAASRGADEGTTHVALTQTSGRGRGDHRWWSPAGAGLWMTTLLRPRLPRHDWSGLSLLCGVSVRRALGDVGVRGVEVFWPNDLYVGRRKLGGILAEARAAQGRAWVALGIGINIDLTPQETRRDMPDELRSGTICMTEAGPPSTSDPLELAQRVLHALFPLYRKLEDGEPLSSLVGEEIAHRGRRVEVEVPGKPTIEGVVAGLGDRGELLITTPRGETRTIVAGEVRYEH